MAAELELLRLVVVGSVDDGKSTLIGRLLYESNALCDDHILQVKRATRQVGEAIDYSLFTDGLKAEREQGITIDVAYRSFSTPSRRFIVADTPGHVQYTRNMATGASTAEMAIILLDARLGVLPQTRRHAYLASMLGIRHLAVAVNKMDVVGFERGVFETIRRDLDAFLKPLAFNSVRYFPISARDGDNVVAKSPRTSWHEGGTLLEFLHEVPPGGSEAEGPLRFPVQGVLRPHLNYRGFTGQIASGAIAVGDEVVVLPSGRRSRVSAIDTFDGELRRAVAPMSVTLRLADELDVSRGDLMAHPSDAPTVMHELEARVVWLNQRPLPGRRNEDIGRQYLIKHAARLVPARFVGIDAKLNLETLEWEPAQQLALNDVGRVRWECLRPLCADPYLTVRPTGAFVIIDWTTNETIGAGMIERASPQQTNVHTSQVSPAQRLARLGQPGGVLWLDATLERAYALEAALFGRGFAVNVVDGDARAAAACAAAGLLCVCVGGDRVRTDLEVLGARLVTEADLLESPPKRTS